MSIRVLQSLLAIGLLLGIGIAKAPAQHRRPPEPPPTLLSTFLNLPHPERTAKLERTAKPEGAARAPLAARPARPWPTPGVQATTERKNDSPRDVASTRPGGIVPFKASVPKLPSEPEPESATASAFSSSYSSRRGVIVKRAARERSTAVELTQDTSPDAHLSTPHWTPKFAEHAACLQMTDEDLAQPVAVNMAGDLISDRVTVARAVAKMDATLSVRPSVALASHHQDSALDASEKSASHSSDAAAQFAKAMEAAAR